MASDRMATPMTVMIPLGGIGARFQKEGYTRYRRALKLVAPLTTQAVHL